MLSTNIDIKLEPLQGAWQLTTNILNPIESPATDGIVAFVLHMCRTSYGDDLTPLQVQLIRSEPMDASPIEDFFGCNVDCGCSEDTMVFNSSDLNRKLKGANAAVASAMDEVIVSYLVRFDSRDIISRVRQVVANCLVHGEPDKEIVTTELNLSPRTLQRRLSAQHSSVKKIIDETRHQLSLDYMNQKHLSIKEIAFSLGFSDPSNFSRAFKRWEGMTPKDYRKSSEPG